MLPYLKKFNELPADLRNQVSAPEAMAALSDLEKQYGLSLATLVMRVMVKDISILDLSKFFVLEHGLEAKKAQALTDELKNRVFKGAADYLGFSIEDEAPAPDAQVDDWGGASAQSGGTVRGSNFFFSPEDEEEVKELTQKLDVFKEETAAKKEETARVVEARVDKITDSVKINFSSNDLHKRLRQVLTTYVKGVRNRIDTKETLKRSVDEGGLALNDSLANKILDIAEKVMAEPAESLFAAKEAPTQAEAAPAAPKFTPAPSHPKQLVDSGARDVPYDFQALQKKEEQAGKNEIKNEVKSDIDKTSAPASKPAADSQAPEDKPKKAEKELGDFAPEKKTEKVEAKVKDFDPDSLDFSVKDVPLDKDATPTKGFLEVNKAAAGQKAQPAALDLRKENNSQTDVDNNEKTAAQAPEPVLDLKQELRAVEAPPAAPDEMAKKAPAPQAAPVRVTTSGSGKVRMDDVKYIPKLTGPVDELKELTLVDFRRLGPDAQTRTKKIRDKVSFLEQDNYSQRLGGIKAWRQSPVNRLYLTMGQESITQNAGINAIIKNRMNQGEEVLSQEEFEAIMELNKELRF